MELLTPSLSLLVWTILTLLFVVAFIRFLMGALNTLWSREDIGQNTKILWMIFFVVAPVIGIICYNSFGQGSEFETEEEEETT